MMLNPRPDRHPGQVHRGDFVLRLAEGAARPAETLRTHVVTPQLAGTFYRALELIRDAIGSTSTRTSIRGTTKPLP